MCLFPHRVPHNAVRCTLTTTDTVCPHASAPAAPPDKVTAAGHSGSLSADLPGARRHGGRPAERPLHCSPVGALTAHCLPAHPRGAALTGAVPPQWRELAEWDRRRWLAARPVTSPSAE